MLQLTAQTVSESPNCCATNATAADSIHKEFQEFGLGKILTLTKFTMPITLDSNGLNGNSLPTCGREKFAPTLHVFIEYHTATCSGNQLETTE
jgi:hypothetical protein